jgi:hypothetical protein
MDTKMMATPTCMHLTKFNVKARPEDSIWQLVYPFVQGPGLLKFEASGKWKYSDFADPCSANGDLDSPLDNRGCVDEKSPLGALIGRIGGSIAASDGVFIVGTVCVRKLGNDVAGPLFLAINDKRNGFGDNADELVVEIKYARDPAQQPAGNV